MNKVDKAYLDLLRDIIDNGVEKDTRAGRVKSVFGRQLRFNLKEGLPLLTTKKVFTKGVIHELLWFLQRPCNNNGSMNINYLVRNGVHIWDDDAYRWFKNNIVPQYKGRIKEIVVCDGDDEVEDISEFEYWIENDIRKNDEQWLENISKEEFIDLVLQRVELRTSWIENYRFGDLGPIYGKQWRIFGANGKDQIESIINTLKTNPNDRRMLCVAYNPDELNDMALPPCHVMFQFYTRELSVEERTKLFIKKSKGIKPLSDSEFDDLNIPKYGLSCMFNMRSNDYMCGTPFNWLQYALLTHIIAKLVNMIPDELVYSVGDCHIYLNHMDGINEQLSRKGSDKLPRLIIRGKQKAVEDFKFEDFKIVGYNPDPPIKFPLNVG